ncbi:hypothetical protein RND81_01G061500 [Saponaria officinalis]|uniref:Patatin n=1 Tax=Saponaria officinalis TaxID=3572 RepID=A0AAW1ND26_SAPOF
MEFNKMTMEIFSKLEQQWLSSQTTTASDARKTKILTIDGGGTSVLVAGAFLIHLEDIIQVKTGDSAARVVDFFDIVAGTGVGGLLAVLISAADSAGRPLFSARGAVSFLLNNRDLIFKRRHSGVRGLFRRRKSGDVIEKVLKSAFKDMTLKDTCKPILVPCYDTVSSAPFVFSRAAASASAWTSLDFELWKVCAAAIATPAILPPFEISSVDGKTSFVAVDGGVVMNNPSAAAVTHALHNKVDFPAVNGVEDLLVLSFGNGSLSCCGSGKKWSGNSKNTVKCVVDVAVDGVSEIVDQMLTNAFSCYRNDYVRIQANGFDGSGLMTAEKALKERGIESITFGGKRLLAETNGDRIEGFVQRLVNSSTKPSLPPSPYKSLSPLLDGR